MARETKEQRVEREAQEAFERELGRQKFQRELPKRLFEAQALAQSLGVETSVRLSENGPFLKFEHDDTNTYINDTLSYLSEEWEVNSIEQTLKKMKEEQDAREVRKQLAQAAFDRLTQEERSAIKEHIFSLRPFQ